MKIVIAGKYLAPNGIQNGVVNHVYNLSKSLAAFDPHEVHVVTLGDRQDIYQDGRVSVHIVKRMIHNAVTPLDSLAITREIEKIDPDIVHAHESGYPYSTALLLVKNKFIRIMTIHGNTKLDMLQSKKISFKAYFGGLLAVVNERMALRFINNIIICTPDIGKKIGLKGRNVAVIPNGIDTSSEYFVKSRPSNDQASDVFYIGKLAYRKGVDVLVRSIPVVMREFPNIRVFIAGNGPQHDELLNMSREYHVDHNVRFLGYIDGVEKFSLLKSTKICIVPSREEAFGIVILEAMSCEKPVIASNIGGIPYIIDSGNTGILFECGNEAELAENIIYLLKNEAVLKNMGACGKKKIADYEWDKVARQTLAFYHSLKKTAN